MSAPRPTVFLALPFVIPTPEDVAMIGRVGWLYRDAARAVLEVSVAGQASIRLSLDFKDHMRAAEEVADAKVFVGFELPHTRTAFMWHWCVGRASLQSGRPNILFRPTELEAPGLALPGFCVIEQNVLELRRRLGDALRA